MQPEHRTRRDLLRAGVSGLTATLLAGEAALAQASSDADRKEAGKQDKTLPARMKLSIAAYSYRQYLDTPGKPGKMSLFDLADLCADLGIDAIEPTSYYFLRDDDQFVYRLKRHIFMRGLEISGTPIRSNFCLPAGPALDETLAHVRKWVDIAARLGSPTIRIFAGGKPENASDEDAFRNAVASMKTACDYAGSKGIFLAIENHGYLTETADKVLRLLDGVNHEWLGANLDTGNFHDDPYGSIARLAPRAVVCQVKTLVRNPQTGQTEPADLARIIDILRQARYRGYVALEYEDKAVDPHEGVPACIRKLQKLV